MKFRGYRRSNGSVGIRNHVLIFPTVLCASTVAQMINSRIPNTVCVTHPYGCGHLGEDKDQIIQAMIGFNSNPNVSGVLLAGLGCEQITPELIGEELLKAGKNVEVVSIQHEGGTTKAVERGEKLARNLLLDAQMIERELVDTSELTIGVHTSASDALSGLTANPAVGVTCDLLVAEGGTVILSDTAELMGVEHILAKRAIDDEVRKSILGIIRATEARINAMGVDIRGSEPSPGNIEGGLTTIEEKSVSSIQRCGTSRIMQVVRYAEKPSRKGLIVMDSPSFHVISSIGMVAGGAQLILTTTGRGSTLGLPIAPVIKVASNTVTYDKMRENIDINAGVLLDGGESVESLGEKILTEIIDVASGNLTKTEILGHREFALYTVGTIP